MALPQHVLLKATEVRWNSLYQKCDRFYQNKRAISLFIENSAGGIQHFTDVDWELIGALVEQLKPIFFVTKELEKRRSTISSIVPMYRSLLNKLRKFNTAFSNRVADGLESRMTGWEMKRKLIVPVILDPNFKMDFFDREMREMYKMWLVDELVQNVEVRLNPNTELEIEAEIACTSESSNPISILDEFVQENSFGEIETLCIDTNETDRVKQEVNAYLIEPRSNVDIFQYWKINSEKWPRLTNLFRRFNSAPVGSQESERLFSIAGITLTDLRNRLTAENLEKLLFLHHNLPIYDFTY